jgi:hypothetical protein
LLFFGSVVVVFDVCDAEAAVLVDVLEVDGPVVDAGIGIGLDIVVEEVLTPGSAKMVPKLGMKVEDEQQFPSYAQHHDPPFDAALQAITFTALPFPAIRRSIS